ncbi:DUF2784 domain-containing protein [Nonomuraea sp. NPDC000554]|uniref:DUF2784 domain-containing protein n=1 Tax=Nonomuraea sp. NPDC000554 TaxID=3154259 RepID=UPI0033272E01
MMYRLIAELAMVAHFAFLAYLVLGGFLAWRWRRTIIVHLAVVAWALFSLASHVECPLTDVEDWGRRNAGLPQLPPSGFIDYYIEGVVYPEQYTNLVRLGVAVLILFSYVGYLLRRP